MTVLDTGTDVLTAELDRGVLVLTLDRSERRNALSAAMLGALRAQLEAATDDDRVRIILLRAAGPAFCAGGDIRDGSRERMEGPRQTYEQRVAQLEREGQVAVALHESPKLSIAAVQGPAVGAGMSLALACDLRVASEAASLTTGWVRLALGPDLGGSWFLTRLVGPSRALELLTTGRTVDAAEAHRLGLVDRVVAADGFDAAARAWAVELARGPVTSYRASKAAVHDAGRIGLRDAVRGEAERSVRCSRTPDHGEAVRAWLEGRPARFFDGADDGEAT